MSEPIYTVVEKQGGKVICCGKRPVLVQLASFEIVAEVLNKEIAPMIEALDEKSLELMQANERIAELEATLSSIVTSHSTLANAVEAAQQALAKKAGGNG